MNIDKDAALEAFGRVIDVMNADTGADHHLGAGGGEALDECSWFFVVARSGSEAGEMLRAMMQDSFVDPARRQDFDTKDGRGIIHETFSRPGMAPEETRQ